MMFHVPNIKWTGLQAKALGLPLLTRTSEEGEGAELEALRATLEEARGLGAEGIVAGAVASQYQAKRIRRIAEGLDLEVMTPLWGMDPAEEVRGVISAGFRALFVAVAAEGLGMDWLGRSLDDRALEDLQTIHHRFGIHISGEGGEYETMVLAGPNMKGRVVIDFAEKEARGLAGVYRIQMAHWEA